MKNQMPKIVGNSDMNMDEYVSSKVFLATAPLPEIKHENIHKLYYIYFILFIIATIVLLYERSYRNRYLKNKELDDWVGIRRLRSRRRKGFVNKLIYRIISRVIIV